MDLVFNGVKPVNGIIDIRFIGARVDEGDQTVRGEAFVQAIEIGLWLRRLGRPAGLLQRRRHLTGNLLLNSGFEETKAGAPADKHGQYAGDEWRAELKGSAMVYLWQESAFAGRPKEGLPEFHSGQGAMRTHAEKDCHTQVYQDIDVQPGATYTGSVWVRAADLQGKGFGQNPKDSAALILMELDDTLKPLGQSVRAELKKTGPYTRLTQTLTVGPRTTKVRFMLETVLNCSVWEGHVTYDDCDLRLGPKAP